MQTLEKTIVKNAIRLVLGGSLFDEKIDIYEIPSLLKELAEDYNIEIEKLAKDLT